VTLKSGTHLGPYEIATQIGAGGMGEVYPTTLSLRRSAPLDRSSSRTASVCEIFCRPPKGGGLASQFARSSQGSAALRPGLLCDARQRTAGSGRATGLPLTANAKAPRSMVQVIEAATGSRLPLTAGFEIAPHRRVRDCPSPPARRERLNCARTRAVAGPLRVSSSPARRFWAGATK
jgi:hypothetical protein